MPTTTQAHIYLADQRGCSETDVSRSFHTLNYGQYVAEGREPFGPLRLLNDETVSPQAGLTYQVDQPTDVLLLPVSGAVELNHPRNELVWPGQLVRLSLPAGASYTVSNPYETEPVNFLHYWVTNPGGSGAPGYQSTAFDPTTRNTLLPLFDPNAAPASGRLFLGRYDGREEGTYSIDGPDRGVFVFVLQGVFEVANRLLHEKDGLALWCEPGDDIDFEALSNDSLLCLLAVPLPH
ncbi:pirin [Fibrisoma montanum]|uniref:Pirin n=1 Tax=Fibrisoma montanum TaxID=2305895 RepID=A0A418M6U3_9BACT|nr:pirin [Fibrisoma montanum]RIV21637.1 pirin [Fibrisoma montanum]